MKIIQLIQRPQLRGAEIFAYQLSEELGNQGHDSMIVSIFDAKSEATFPVTTIGLGGSETKRLWDFSAWRRLAEIVKRESPDLVQANAGDTLKYAVFSRLFFRWKTPIIFRNASTVSLYIKSPIIRLWNSFLIQSTNYVISVSEFSREDFVNVFPAARKKVSVIPIGVKIPDVSISELQVNESMPFFLHIGGFTFEKNHRGLISIFERLKLKYPSARLGLVGDGPLRHDVEQLVASKGLQHSVTFYGFQIKPEDYLKQAQCLLLPSIIEGMPAVVLEAFLYKVPVVAYDVGGIPEIVRPDKTGWLVNKNDEGGFFKQACEAIENREKVKLMTDNALHFAFEEFSIKEITKKFVTAYIEIIRANAEHS